MDLGGTYNFRDLGGHALAGGGATGPGLLFRSDRPRPGPGAAAAVRALGLRTVIDLRDAGERALRPGLTGEPGVRTVHRNLPMNTLIMTRPALRESLAVLYMAAVQELGEHIAAAIGELCRPDALPALVHCAAGKDRTGIVIALTLSALGVSDADVAADYALTAGFLERGYFAELEQQKSPAFDAGIDLSALRGSEPEAILAALEAARALSGDTRRYLAAHGVPAAGLKRLRAALSAGDHLSANHE